MKISSVVFGVAYSNFYLSFVHYVFSYQSSKQPIINTHFVENLVVNKEENGTNIHFCVSYFLIRGLKILS